MKTTGRLGLLALALALASASCTGASGTVDGGGDGVGGPTPPDVVIRPGDSGVYRYVNAGLVATLDLRARTLEIENATGRTLAKPAFYALHAEDGHRVDGRVIDPAPIPAGETVRFAVELDGIAPKDIGLIVLLIGRDNYGAFVQT
jgi:hypothetical protein